MNAYTIEAWREKDVTTWLVMTGFPTLFHNDNLHNRWQFRRANQNLVVVGMNFWVSQELASVAVDDFLRPRTDLETINLSRFSVLLVGGGRKK